MRKVGCNSPENYSFLEINFSIGKHLRMIFVGADVGTWKKITFITMFFMIAISSANECLLKNIFLFLY